MIKPIIPRKLQLFVRRISFKRKVQKYNDIWPINPHSAEKPDDWSGWPNNKRFALVLTHDVEYGQAQEKCLDLLNIEKALHVKSAFNFVPERYKVNKGLLNRIQNNGFEVGVHGLKHDGKLYFSRKIFKERSIKINKYLREWQAVGFRSPSMHHNLEWIHDLDIIYDGSTFDTDPFEPYPNGVNTIFPFVVSKKNQANIYVELPYTLAQDTSLFLLLQEKNINKWKEKVDWIVEKGGMVLVNTHPDYMNFGNTEKKYEYPIEYYINLIKYIQETYKDRYWQALPKEIADFIIKRKEIS